MKKILLIAGSVLMLLIIIFNSDFYQDYRNNIIGMSDYYRDLARKCGSSECCIYSVKSMSRENSVPTIEDKCQKGDKLTMSEGCEKSYKWCEKIENSIMIWLWRPITKDRAEEIAVAANGIAEWKYDSKFMGVRVKNVETEEDVYAALASLRQFAEIYQASPTPKSSH